MNEQQPASVPDPEFLGRKVREVEASILRVRMRGTHGSNRFAYDFLPEWEKERCNRIGVAIYLIAVGDQYG